MTQAYLDQLDVRFETIAEVDQSFVPDPLGYFIIRATKRGLRAEHYTNEDLPTLVYTLSPDIPLDSQAEALRKKILSAFPTIDKAHYGYICQELALAQAALSYEFNYVQS